MVRRIPVKFPCIEIRFGIQEFQFNKKGFWSLNRKIKTNMIRIACCIVF